MMKEMFYLTTHSTHYIYGYMASDITLRRQNGYMCYPVRCNIKIKKIDVSGFYNRLKVVSWNACKILRLAAVRSTVGS